MNDNGRHPQRRARKKVSKKITGRNYVVHLAKPIGGDKQQAQHYTGFTKKTVAERVQDHKDGKPGSAAILRAANEKGIDYWPVCDWPGNTDIENQLKLHSARIYCRECAPEPRVPKVVQQAIKREERSRKYQERKAKAAGKVKQLMATPLTKGEKQALGSEAASGYVPGMLGKGLSADQIERAAEDLYDGEGDYRAGFDRQIDSDLQLARELEKQHETERARIEEAALVDTYRDNLTALADHEAKTYEPPSWLPTAEELTAHPAYAEREAG